MIVELIGVRRVGHRVAVHAEPHAAQTLGGIAVRDALERDQ
jgi:hypothetical protein